MPLNLSKLQDLLASKGFIPNKYFVLDGTCFYIELFSIKTADIFLLYIPSKYDFVIPSSENSFKLNYINMDSVDGVPDEYAGKPDDMDIEAAYGGMNVELSPDKEHIADHLESNYKHPISLNEISKDDATTLRAVYRQMLRLRYCVQNIKYKLGVIYKNYICAIRRDDTVDCFAIKHHPRSDRKKLMVVVDLETLYEKNDKLLEDIHTVRDSIYRVLERNQGMHTRVIGKMIENRKDILTIPDQTAVKKTKYDTMLAQLNEMLEIMVVAERRVLDALFSLEEKSQGLQNDISRVHEKARLEKELDKINVIKGEITKNMVALRDKREDSVLSIDKIMFDNSVMFDAMIKNFAKLKDYC